MHSSLKLFIIGMIVGLTIPLIAQSDEVDDLVTDPEKLIKRLARAGANLWTFLFFAMLVVTLPFLAIEPLKKRFTMKRLMPFPFLAGNGMGFGIMNLISILLSIG